VIDKKLNWNLNSRKKESGQSLVEMALVFTTVVLILSILVDVGRAFFTLIALHDASQEGALYASMKHEDGSWKDAILTSSTEPIDFQAESDSGIFRVEPLQINGTGNCAGFDASGNANTVIVIVSYDFNFIMPLLDTIVPSGQITLRAQSDSTIMYPPCP
jgi:Flp pilus assembly protein TadG